MRLPYPTPHIPYERGPVHGVCDSVLIYMIFTGPSNSFAPSQVMNEARLSHLPFWGPSEGFFVINSTAVGLTPGRRARHRQ